MMEFEHKDIAWTCAGCGETGDRNLYATMVTTACGEVVEVEDSRVISIEPQFPVEVEHLCRECFEKKYKAVKVLRTALVAVTRAIELIEADSITGDLGALEKLHLLVEHIADSLPREEEAIDG